MAQVQFSDWGVNPEELRRIKKYQESVRATRGIGPTSDMTTDFMRADLGAKAEKQIQRQQLGLQERGLEFEKEKLKESIASAKYGIDVGAATSKYGVDVGAKTSKYGVDVQAETSKYGIDVGAETSKYGVDVGAETSKYGVDVQAAVDREQIEATRYGIDVDAAVKTLGITTTSADFNKQLTANIQIASDNLALDWSKLESANANALADRQQNASQFAQTLGLETEKFKDGVRQFNEIMKLKGDEFEFEKNKFEKEFGLSLNEFGLKADEFKAMYGDETVATDYAKEKLGFTDKQLTSAQEEYDAIFRPGISNAEKTARSNDFKNTYGMKAVDFGVIMTTARNVPGAVGTKNRELALAQKELTFREKALQQQADIEYKKIQTGVEESTSDRQQSAWNAVIKGTLGGVTAIAEGTWICTEVKRIIGINQDDWRTIAKFREYAMDKHPGWFDYYTKIGPSLIAAIGQESTNFYAELKSAMIDSVVEKTASGDFDGAFSVYRKYVLKIINQFKPDLIETAMVVDAADKEYKR